MGDKQTIVDIKTRYDGRGAAAAKQDVQALASASTGGLKTEAAATDQLKQKADALGNSTKELSKSKIALNAATLALRGSFGQAAQQLDKLGGAWKTFAGAVGGSLALLAALVAIITTLISKWKEHRASLAEADKQLKALNWARVQESIDLNFEKSKKGLADWISSLEKAEVQAKNTAAAILLVKAAHDDAEMAKIDLKESRGELTKKEAQQQRNNLARTRELSAIENDRVTAQNDIDQNQDVIYKASGDKNRIEGQADSDASAFDAQVQRLRDSGAIDENAAAALSAMTRTGGSITDEMQKRLDEAVQATRQKRAKNYREQRVEQLTPSYGKRVAREIVEGDETASDSALLEKYKAQDSQGIEDAVNLARRTGVSRRAADQQIPLLDQQMSKANEKLRMDRAILQAYPDKRLEIDRKYEALDIPLRQQDPAYISSTAENTLNNGGVMEFPGRRDNTGQVVPGGGAAQAARAQQLVQRAQELVVGGADDAAVAERLAQLLNQLGVKIKVDKQTFYNLVDQLDGIANEVGDLKAREKANKAGE